MSISQRYRAVCQTRYLEETGKRKHFIGIATLPVVLEASNCQELISWNLHNMQCDQILLGPLLLHDREHLSDYSFGNAMNNVRSYPYYSSIWIIWSIRASNFVDKVQSRPLEIL